MLKSMTHKLMKKNLSITIFFVTLRLNIRKFADELCFNSDAKATMHTPPNAVYAN